MAFSFSWIWVISEVAIATRSHRSKGSWVIGHKPLELDSTRKAQSHTKFLSSLPNVTNLEIGQKGEALVPALVPPHDEYFQWKSRQARSWFPGFGRKGKYGFRIPEFAWWLATYGVGNVLNAKGGWVSNNFGNQLMKVRDLHEKEIFVIRREKKAWPHFQWREGFRIYAPLPSDDQYTHAEPLFTIKMNLKVFLWMRAEYRVYEGRVKDEKPLYYGIADRCKRMEVYRAQGRHWDELFLQEKGRDEWLNDGRTFMAAHIKPREIRIDGVRACQVAADEFDIITYAGTDSALMLALAAIWQPK